MVSRWVNASSKWTSETKEKSKRVGSGLKPVNPVPILEDVEQADVKFDDK
ncbi:11526_t:CDS:2 [Funneliformis caledonium]|uniref:11526_t:CDS:1 n=1 Tax=Funneliformis caledonium TaxID=1117310 RepID=A0A9N9CHM1_9GLOM|nr:11526_t:CDS:2 [Funneliformis caledonium]